MYKLLDAVRNLQADNPLGLPIIKSVHEAVPIKGTNLRSGVFYVITERETLEFARNLANHPRLRFLEKVRYNVLSAGFLTSWRSEPGTVPPPEIAELVIYDYTNNIGYRVEADFPRARRVILEPLREQPDLFSEAEYQDAVHILAQDPKYGEPLRRGIAFCSPGMPPVLREPAPHSPFGRLDPMPIGKPAPHHRTVSVLMHFLPGSGREGEVGVFAIDMVGQRVAGYATGASDFFPAACNGPQSGSCGSSGGGTAWQALSWGDWSMLVRRPRGTYPENSYGAGVELRDVFYQGRLVIRRAGMPVLNVFYDGNACGPYRDWLYSETCFKCNGTDLGNGLRIANEGTRALTICDDMDDAGSFYGVGIYEQAGELVLISECSAGWYRYITGWRFHPSGIIRPRFQYGYVDSGCVCYGRLHNAYWRIHFALDGQGGHVVEETDAPVGARRVRWNPFRIEARRIRPFNRPRRWRVRKLSTGFTADIVPNSKDGSYETSTTGEADFWVLQYKTGSSGGDGELNGNSAAFANISQYVNGERVYDANVVVWYGVHLRKRGADTFECPPLGPDIILSG